MDNQLETDLECAKGRIEALRDLLHTVSAQLEPSNIGKLIDALKIDGSDQDTKAPARRHCYLQEVTRFIADLEALIKPN